MNYNSTAIKDILNLTDDDCEVTDFPSKVIQNM